MFSEELWLGPNLVTLFLFTIWLIWQLGPFFLNNIYTSLRKRDLYPWHSAKLVGAFNKCFTHFSSSVGSLRAASHQRSSVRARSRHLKFGQWSEEHLSPYRHLAPISSRDLWRQELDRSSNWSYKLVFGSANTSYFDSELDNEQPLYFFALLRCSQKDFQMQPDVGF